MNITGKPAVVNKFPLLTTGGNESLNHADQKLHSKKFQTYITYVRTTAEMLPFCYFTHGG